MKEIEACMNRKLVKIELDETQLLIILESLKEEKVRAYNSISTSDYFDKDTTQDKEYYEKVKGLINYLSTKRGKEYG